MYENNCILKEDYNHCTAYTERLFVEGLRLHDYIPPEITKRADIAAEKDNCIVVDDGREGRERRIIPRKWHSQSKLPLKVTN
jgi:hypothetical protein